MSCAEKRVLQNQWVWGALDLEVMGVDTTLVIHVRLLCLYGGVGEWEEKLELDEYTRVFQQRFLC